MTAPPIEAPIAILALCERPCHLWLRLREGAADSASATLELPL